MRLSEAIRLGAMLSPQAFGTLHRTRRRWRWFGPVIQESCALGAAFEAGAVGSHTKVSDGSGFAFRGQAAAAGEAVSIVETPASWTTMIHRNETCPQCGTIEPLGRLIPHLNDQHRWTRGNIAGFVERLEQNLIGWWGERQAQCLVNGAWQMNDLDRASLELRQRLAAQMQGFYPSQSTCEHCGWPWGFVEAHHLTYSSHGGCFVVCEWCFKQLRNYGDRDAYVASYRAAYERYWSNEPECWPLILAALEQEWPSRLHSLPAHDEAQEELIGTD